MIEVTQADREAAGYVYDGLKSYGVNKTAGMGDSIRDGLADGNLIVQEFARRRQQAEDAIIRAADDWLSTQYGLRPLVADLARIRATPPKPDRLNGEGEHD